MACIHHQSIIQNSLTALKILCAPPSHSAPTQPLATADPFYCLHICLSRMSDSQNHTLSYFYNWLLSLSMGIGGSSVSFHALIAYLFLVLNNILLSGFTTIFSFIHLLKNILFASKFWTL